MHAISLRRVQGFSLIEAMVTIIALSLVLAIGMPAMANWVAVAKAQGAAEFYAEGVRTARGLALKHNAASRLVFSENSSSGQLDWQVDICYPSDELPCNRSGSNWSTALNVATNEPEGASGYRSLVRSARELPSSTIMSVTLAPDGADAIYFTSLGWVDVSIASRVTRVTIGSVDPTRWVFPSSSIAIPLSGMASKCVPGAAVGDSRRCPP